MTVTGEVDVSTIHVLTDSVDQVMREPRNDALSLLLDLAGVTLFCADGVRALLDIRRVVIAAGGTLTLRRPSHSIRLVFDITGDAKHFDIHDVADPS
jgi:anti-anti-sigma factor